jgi:hypothetical protein
MGVGRVARTVLETGGLLWSIEEFVPFGSAEGASALSYRSELDDS